MLQMLGGQKVIPKYANSFEISANPIEFRLIFGVQSLGDIIPDVNTELIVAPTIAKGIAIELMKAIKKWEKDQGPIFMPDDTSGLAALFGGPISDVPVDPHE